MQDSNDSRLGRHVIAAVSAAMVLGLIDALATLARSGPRVSVGAFLTGAFHLLGMVLPVGVVAGLAVAAVAAIVSKTPALAALGRRVAPRRWLEPDPEGVAVGVMLLFAVGGWLAAAWRGFVFFATQFRKPELAGMAAAVVSVAALGLLAAMVPIGAGLLAHLTRRLGRAACLGAVVALLAVLAAAAVGIAAALGLFVGSDPVRLSWLPLAAVLYVILFAVAPILAGRRRATLLGRRAGLAVSLFALVAGLLTAVLYSDSSRVRAVVEQRSVAGPMLHRAYSRLTDLDRDGHAWAFGGGDCDDFDGEVYPGAIDERGDGVDADCLGGDGSPLVEDFGDGGYGQVPEGLDQPNILFVTVDALRPDHLGINGYERDVSPRIDEFAEDAVVFADASAASSRSLRSIPAFFTGFYPSQIAYGPEMMYVSVADENRTAAEVLADAGYATWAVMGSNYFKSVEGFFQGFDGYDQELRVFRVRPERAVADTLERVDELDDAGRPWFVWVHLMNVHAPYLHGGPPSRFGSQEIDAYDTEVSLADRSVGVLLDGLDSRGLADETVVVLGSDHGEAFGEHGTRYHAQTVYQEEIHSTLMIRIPGVEPRVVDAPVSLIDLAPTFFNLAGVPVPAPMPGRSLLPFATGERPPAEDRLLFSEVIPDGHNVYDQKMIRRGDDKLIWFVREGRHQLFDLGEDPREQEDLSDERRDLALELRGLLQAWTSQTARRTNLGQLLVAENRLDALPARMDERLDLVYGGAVRVVGYDLPERVFSPGDRIDITLYYEAVGETDQSYRIDLTFRGDAATRVPDHFHAWHYPLGGHYLTSQWRAGELLRDPVQIVVPPDMPVPSELELVLQIRGQGRFLDPAGPEGAVVPLTQLRFVPASGEGSAPDDGT